MAELGAAKGSVRQTLPTDKVATPLDVKVIELRRQQKRCIGNLDFDAAEELEQEIKTLRFDGHDEQAAKFSKDLTERAAEIVGACNEAIERFTDQKSTDQKKLRIRINAQFEIIQSQQVRALVEMEKDFAAARLRETERTIPEQEQLLHRARRAGTAKQFDEARRLRDAAAMIGETDLRGRLMVLDEGFDQKRRQLLKAQRTEIEVLSARLDSEMRTIEEFTRHNIAKEGELRTTKLIALMDQYGRRMATLGAPGDMDERVVALERQFTELLISLNCPVPRGIGCSARTRPVAKEQAPTKKVPRRTG
jgi:hypothetical protein